MHRFLPVLLAASLAFGGTAFAAPDRHAQDASTSTRTRDVLNKPIRDVKLFTNRHVKLDRSREVHPIRDLKRFANKHVKLDRSREVHPIRDLKRFTHRHVRLRDDRSEPARRRG